MRSYFIFILSFFLFTSLVYTILINKNEVCPMMKRLYYSLIITIGYLIVSNLGNMVFGISKEFSWTTTLWESLFFSSSYFVTKLSKKINMCHLSVGTCFRIYGTFIRQSILFFYFFLIPLTLLIYKLIQCIYLRLLSYFS